MERIIIESISHIESPSYYVSISFISIFRFTFTFSSTLGHVIKRPVPLSRIVALDNKKEQSIQKLANHSRVAAKFPFCLAELAVTVVAKEPFIEEFIPAVRAERGKGWKINKYNRRGREGRGAQPFTRGDSFLKSGSFIILPVTVGDFNRATSLCSIVCNNVWIRAWNSDDKGRTLETGFLLKNDNNSSRRVLFDEITIKISKIFNKKTRNYYIIISNYLTN